MLGILRVALEEIILKIVRWKRRGVLSRTCISENSQNKMTFSVGESASRPKYAYAQLLLNSLCHGSMKWRWLEEMARSVDDFLTSQSIKLEFSLDF